MRKTCRIFKTLCVLCCFLKWNRVKHRSSDTGICSVSPLHRKALLSNQQQQVRSAGELMLWELYWQVFGLTPAPWRISVTGIRQQKQKNTPTDSLMRVVSAVLKLIIINQSSITSQARYRQNGPISCNMLDVKLQCIIS